MPELDASEIARRLARPDTHPYAFGRRRFLQAAAVVGGGALLAEAVPGLERFAAAATPLAAGDGVLVVVNLEGGNDAMNTVVPYASGRYVDDRGVLAIDATQVHRLDGQVGLHPSLGYLSECWTAGRLAVVEGVGDAAADLSHFTSMARWMAGTAGSPGATGWLGRYLDGLAVGDDAFAAVTLGSDVPLVLHGERRSATALGEQAGAFGTSPHAHDLRLADAVRDLAAAPNARGPWADAIATVGRRMVDVNVAVAPLYTAALPSGRTPARFELAARLLNADLGIRVLLVTVTGFDTHAGQRGQHASLLRSLDEGLRRFSDALTAPVAARTAVLVLSEFGRQARGNDSEGTDHGTAGVHMVLGDRVRGGRYGAPPSLDVVDAAGRLRPTVDQRAVFATVLRRWLGADDRAVLGATYETFDLFRAAPAAAPGVVPVVVPPAGRVVPVTPARLLDTRAGVGAAVGRVTGIVDLQVVGGASGAPAGASAVVLNVTVTEPGAPGFVTVWPAGEARPLASCVNYAAGDTVPNLVVAKVGADGRVSMFASGGSPHLVADIVGYAGDLPGSTFVPVSPTRLLDTRADRPVGGPGPRRVAIAGAGPVPADGVTGVVMNVTVTDPSSGGYLTVWPGGSAQPLASSLNVVRGGTAPNLVMVPLGAGGDVQLAWSAGTAHVVLDAVGFLTTATTGLHLRTMTPTRLLDTRDGTGGGRRLGAADTIELAVAGHGGVPAGAGAVVLNLTATESSEGGFVTVSPAGRPRPLASTLNLAPGRTVANLAVALLGDGGSLWLYNATGSTHLVADVVGWFD